MKDEYKEVKEKETLQRYEYSKKERSKNGVNDVN